MDRTFKNENHVTHRDTHEHSRQQEIANSSTGRAAEEAQKFASCQYDRSGRLFRQAAVAVVH